MRNLRLGYIVILVSLLLVLTACNDEESDLRSQPVKETSFLLGTVVNLTVYDKGSEATVDEAIAMIDQYEQLLSDEIETSEVSQINQQAGINPVKVSEEVFQLIEDSIDYGELSNGGFDITVGPLTNLWRIGYDDARKPSDEEITEVLAIIDHQSIVLDEENQTVFLPEEAMELDLGAIAKGYISDRVNELFDEAGVSTAIIDLGGNIYVKGNRPTGTPWTVGVQNPFLGRGELIGRIEAVDKSVVTSGIYERYLEVDGETYHHLLDPDTGYPFDNTIAGVTIVSETSVQGDALSTAVFANGVNGGKEIIESLEEVEAIFVTKDQEVILTSGLVDQFELLNEQFTIIEEE